MSDNDWRVAEPPAGAVPLPPISIQEKPKEVQEAEVLERVANEPVKPEGFQGLPVRLAGDKIWLLKEGKRAWISSAEVYARLGFKFGDEREIDSETLMMLPEAEPIK